jgi:hypothetical protein
MIAMAMTESLYDRSYLGSPRICYRDKVRGDARALRGNDALPNIQRAYNTTTDLIFLFSRSRQHHVCPAERRKMPLG